jgi:hypothetical protein
MLEFNVPQLSDEWFQCRIGIPSASCFSKVVTSKGEPSKQARDYAYTLAGERIIDSKVETHQSAAMLRGVEMEEEARQLFELMTGYTVRQTGIIYPDENKQYSCSPDGIIDEIEEGLEIKSPLLHTHVGYLIAGKLPVDYVQQVQGSMLITGFKAWHFFSYYPGMPPLHLKVNRDETFIGKLKEQLDQFCGLVDRTVEQLRGAA